MEGQQQKPEKVNPKVILHFLRHSIKEEGTGKDDKDISLSGEGRELAARKYENPLDMRYAHVEASPRMRTQETAATTATKDAKARPEDLGVGKMRIREALDYNLDETEGYGKRLYEKDAEGKLLSFLLHESDAAVRASGDTTSSTYSRMAANIAGIIYRNYQTASRGASMFERSEHSQSEHNDFERILATHGAIQECFLLKAVEKVKGIAAHDALLAVIGEKGFDFTEGFDVTLSKENGMRQIRITYKRGEYVLNEIVPVSVIEEIIEEGN